MSTVIKILMTVYRYLAYFMALLTFFVFAVGASELLSTIYIHSGRMIAYPLTYLFILLLPVSLYVLFQLHKTKVEFKPAEAQLNLFVEVVAAIILGVFHIELPNIDAFYQIVGIEIVILLILAVALSIKTPS